MLSLAVLYQDAWTQNWVERTCEWIQNLARNDPVACAGWPLADLNEPATFHEASAQAAEADLVLVSVRASETLPPLLCSWLEAWVPLHAGKPGALIALLGKTEPAAIALARTRDYLRALIEPTGLSLVIDERKLPAAALDSSPSQTQPSASALEEAGEDAPSSYYVRHWGINE